MDQAATQEFIDAHVHVLGNGSSGSGCWLTLRGHHKLLARYILRGLGLPSGVLNGDLDFTYVDLLRKFVANSCLGKVVLLAHENVYDDNGRIIQGFGSFHVPNKYILRLAAEESRFLAGVSIHPARADALDELEFCIESGAVMMKCLPNCQNIDCSNPRYVPFWERMAKAGLPLLAHTGGELSVPVFNAAYARPEHLRLPLECGVTVIAAHCATSSTYWDPCYFSEFTAMLEKYPRLYGDNSGMQTPIRSRHLPQLLAKELKGRIIHGSDFPIPISATWARLRGQISAAAHRELKGIKNPLELDVQLKRAMGFDDETFTLARQILRIR